jgi:hypothetical protein
VPSKDTSTYANAAADMKGFYSDVIMPWGRRLAEAWTSFLGVENQRRYIHADYSHVDVLQENRKEKADVDKTVGETYEKAWLNGRCTLNDWRVACGDEKITDNPLYEKTLLELLPEELATVQAVLKLKSGNVPQQQPTTPEGAGDETPGVGGQLQ